MADTENVHDGRAVAADSNVHAAQTHQPHVEQGGEYRVPLSHRKYLKFAHCLGVECGPGEKIHMLVRRHWLFELAIALKCLLLIAVPAGICFWLLPILGTWKMVTLLVLILYAQFISLFMFKSWLDFYLDAVIVTSHKIVDIDQIGFFNRRISETSLSRVQDAAGDLQGFLGTLLKFGTLEIQTAGNEQKFSLDHIAHPMETAAAIERIQSEYLARFASAPSNPVDVM